MRIKLVPIAFAAAFLLALPSAASARSVLSPGELSVAAELVGDGAPRVSPSAGFLVRYALSHDLALFGDLALFHRFRKGDDPATFYAVGGGAQFVPFSSKHASVLLRGGLQFIPRPDNDGQELGIRFYAGPGVEARLTDNFSLQFFASFLDLQVGGDSTDFDIGLLPSIGAYLYF